MGFSRQEYWRRVPFPSPGIEPGSLMSPALAGGFFTTSATREALHELFLKRMRWWDGITNSMDVNLSKLWEIVENRGAWSTTVLGVEKTQTWLSDWTTTADTSFIPFHQLSLSPFPSFLFLPLDDESYHIRPLIYPPMDSPFMGCILSTQQMPWGHCLPVCPHLGMPNPIWTLRSPVTRFFPDHSSSPPCTDCLIH